MSRERQSSRPRATSARRPRPKRWRRWLLYLAGFVLFLGAAGAAGAVAAYRHFAADVPDVSWAENYRPPIVSDVLSGDDQLLGELYNERRRVVPYERVPKKLVQAFIAAEDVRFFDHGGLDVVATARALVGNALAGRKKSGASTLTQQTAKAILISTWGYKRATEKTYRRKIYEAILGRRLEARFSKEQILHLYLNQVYLGHSSYGVQAAAENYFRKNVWDLTLPEMTLLAGLPQAPSKYSPFRFPERAKARREYVLRRMLEEGMISRAEHDSAAAAEVVVHPVEDVFRETAPFVTEHVRRDLVQRYGNDRLLNDGLKVYATVDLDLEREAIAATLKGILAADRRQGYRGPLRSLAPEEGTPGTKAWTDALGTKVGAFRKLQREKGAAPAEGPLRPEEVYVGVVLSATREAAEVGVGDRVVGTIPLELVRWARKPNSEQHYMHVHLDAVSKALAPGDVILVRAASPEELAAAPKKLREAKATILALEQEPSLQGALVAVDPKSGYIVAMIGGYDFNKSEFNRAFQACRQPGSAFKPLVYSAALDGLVRTDDASCRKLSDQDRPACQEEVCTEKMRGVWDAQEKKCRYTAATPLLDAPMVHDDEVNLVRWKPSNFEHEFRGDVLLREAVILSMNTPAVRTLEAVGARTAVEWSRKLGISTPINEDLSIALGSSCLTLWDLTHVYALFNQNGRRVESTFIRRVVDREGRILEDHSAWFDPWTSLHARLAAGYAALFREPEQVIDPATAFVTTNLLRQVCRSGTAAAASKLGRTVAGKTGTTNDAFDAWFVGYSPELVAGVWVGYDTYETPMGKYETGGRTALPIWMDFMGAALKDRPLREFPVPEGITWAAIDPKSGKLAGERTAAVREAFRAGTEPRENADAPPPASKEGFFGGDL